MIIFLAVLVLFMLLVSLIFLKDILAFIDSRGSSLRNFTHRHSGFFTVLFMFIFFIEQFLLMVVTYFFFDISAEAQLLIGIFALIVLTTATLEKFILEKKYKYLSKEVNTVTYGTERLFTAMKIICKGLYEENASLKKKIKKKR